MAYLSPNTQKRYLSYLGFNSAYDVSKWCAEHGVISKYVEMVVDGRQLSRDNCIQQSWWIKDATTPGVIYKKFSDIISRKSSIHQSKQWSASGVASSWLSAEYDMPVKPIEALYGFFSAIAVDEIMEDLQLLDEQFKTKMVTIETPSPAVVSVVTKYSVKSKVGSRELVSNAG